MARAVTRAFLGASLAVLGLVAGFVAWSAAPALRPEALWDLLVGTPWRPQREAPLFGLRHAWASTLWVTGIAQAIAVPLGIGVAVFVAEVAPPRWRAAVPPLLELLAGVPSVVYGFLGYVTLVAWTESLLGRSTGESLLVAGVILAVMVVPFVGSTSIEALRAVPAEVREAAYSLGVTRWEMVRRVLLPRAAPALCGAVALGFTRAAGETLAVLMLAGNSTAWPRTPIDRGQPLTALIATEMGEAGVGSPKSQALMAAGLVLLLMVVILNAWIWRLRGRVLGAHAS